jgi:hypothetical protein
MTAAFPWLSVAREEGELSVDPSTNRRRDPVSLISAGWMARSIASLSSYDFHLC